MSRLRGDYLVVESPLSPENASLAASSSFFTDSILTARDTTGLDLENSLSRRRRSRHDESPSPGGGRLRRVPLAVLLAWSAKVAGRGCVSTSPPLSTYFFQHSGLLHLLDGRDAWYRCPWRKRRNSDGGVQPGSADRKLGPDHVHSPQRLARASSPQRVAPVVAGLLSQYIAPAAAVHPKVVHGEALFCLLPRLSNLC